MVEFDTERASLKRPDYFQRFRIPTEATPLTNTKLGPETSLLIVERGGQRRALLLHQMAYHHVAQGELAGEPYLVSF